MPEENKDELSQDSKELSGQANRGLYYCWLCGEETFGEPICPSCGIPQ